MDIQELSSKYFIDKKQVDKLETLGLLKGIPRKDGKRDFRVEDIVQLTEMIHLMNLGMDEKSLIRYYQYQSNQIDILERLRMLLISQIHDFQKKLDDIDYMIYQRSGKNDKN